MTYKNVNLVSTIVPRMQNVKTLLAPMTVFVKLALMEVDLTAQISMSVI